MSKILVIGNDPTLRGLIESQPRRHRTGGIQVEYLESADIARLTRKRPEAVVMDFRSPNATDIDVLFRLKMRTHQLSLLLRVTPRQKRDDTWHRILPASRTEVFTSQSSKKEVRGLLQSLLTLPRRSEPVTTPTPENTEAKWRNQNNRRIDLIFKKRDDILTAAEQMELAQLQEEVSRHVDRSRTLDFDVLADFEAEAQKIANRG